MEKLRLFGTWFNTNGIWLLISMFFGNLSAGAVTELAMVIIVPSYNNMQWYKKNLSSIFQQEYTNFRVVYIDDCSHDGTYDAVVKYVQEQGFSNRCTVLRNQQRYGAMYNLYHAIHACADDEIVVLVDGDDWLAHSRVLVYLDNLYRSNNVWLTYGQFVEWPYGRKGFCEPFPQQVIDSNSFRTHGCPVSHLRTFYAWLFKKIDQQDLMYKGEFYPMTWDKAMMLPMLEMAGGRFVCIDDIVYVYNFYNPINDCKVNGDLQAHLARVIMSQPAYAPLQDYEIPELVNGLFLK